jgi:hypothetical protein
MYFSGISRHLRFSTSDPFPFGCTVLVLVPLECPTQKHSYSHYNLVLPSLRAALKSFRCYRPPSWTFHFRFLSIRLYGVSTRPIGIPDPKNIAMAIIFA